MLLLLLQPMIIIRHSKYNNDDNINDYTDNDDDYINGIDVDTSKINNKILITLIKITILTSIKIIIKISIIISMLALILNLLLLLLFLLLILLL